jgi:hypothetical protein
MTKVSKVYRSLSGWVLGLIWAPAAAGVEGATKKSICGRFWRSSFTRKTIEVGWPNTGSASRERSVACLVSFHSTAN